MPRFKIQIQTNPTQVRVLANLHPVQALHIKTRMGKR